MVCSVYHNVLINGEMEHAMCVTVIVNVSQDFVSSVMLMFLRVK